MKRKISMLLSIILVATSLIACNEETQTVESPSPTQTQPSEPATTDEVVEPDLSAETTTPTDTQPDFSDFYDETSLLFNQLSSSTLDLDFEQQAIIDESIMFKVKDFSSFEELNSYLLTIFSSEVIDELALIEQVHVEYEGALYGRPSDVPANIFFGGEVSREIVQEFPVTTIKVEVETKDENFEVNGSELFEFTCEYIGDNWIFTSFPQIRY